MRSPSHLVGEALRGFYREKRRDPALIADSGSLDRLKDQVIWKEHSVLAACVHDEDYRVFRLIGSRDDVVLDIGAHFGYSATSMWAAGCKCLIRSFEIDPAYTQSLQSLRRVKPHEYDFRICGLDSTAMTREYVVPVLNKTVVGALGSICTPESLERLVDDLLSFYNTYMPEEPLQSVQLLIRRLPVDSLDHVLAYDSNILSGSRIVAIKLDAEGAEQAILQGAMVTLSEFRPMLLVERGSQCRDLVSSLGVQGYLMAEHIEYRLHLSTASPRVALNTFFVHKSCLEEYRLRGILA